MSAALPVTTLDDDAWEDLLSFIEERRVVPIVGPERRVGQLAEAVRLIDGLAPELKPLRDVRWLRARILDAQRKG